MVWPLSGGEIGGTLRTNMKNVQTIMCYNSIYQGAGAWCFWILGAGAAQKKKIGAGRNMPFL